MTKSYQNSQWIHRVRTLLKDGWGVEDIGLMLKCSVDDVRLEVSILRESGELENMYKGEKA